MISEYSLINSYLTDPKKSGTSYFLEISLFLKRAGELEQSTIIRLG